MAGFDAGSRPGLICAAVALAIVAAFGSSAGAQTADDVKRIWNDPSTLDRQKQQDERARLAADQVAQQAAQQRAAIDAAQKSVLGLPEEERKRIQGSLATLGFYQGAADGNLASPESAKAVGEWQKAHARPQTGRLMPPEVEALHKEAATRNGPKERLDAEAGIAARRADATRVAPPDIVAKLFDGAREDVIVLLNETPTAPHVQRGATPPAFKDRTVQLCAQFGWQTSGEFASFVRSELARLGADKLHPDLAHTCQDQRPPMDLVLLERRHLFEQPQEKVQPLLAELRDHKLGVLAIVPFSGLAAWRDKQTQEAARKAEEEKQRQEAARLDEERRKQEAVRKIEEDKRREQARLAADDPVQRRKASEPRAQVMSNALLDRLRAAIDGSGSLDEGFEAFKRWYEQRKSEGRQVADMRANVDDYGDGRFQGRKTEAVSVEVYFQLKASGGPAQTDCLVFAWLEETPIRRAPAVFACDRVTALEQWKADNGFRSRWR